MQQCTYPRKSRSFGSKLRGLQIYVYHLSRRKKVQFLHKMHSCAWKIYWSLIQRFSTATRHCCPSCVKGQQRLTTLRVVYLSRRTLNTECVVQPYFRKKEKASEKLSSMTTSAVHTFDVIILNSAGIAIVNFTNITASTLQMEWNCTTIQTGWTMSSLTKERREN